MIEQEVDSLMLSQQDALVTELEGQLEILRLERLLELRKELQEAVQQEQRSKARGLPQRPRKLGGIPQALANWNGSAYGIPVGWLDHLKPEPLRVRVAIEPEGPCTAMRICLHPAQAKQSWARRPGRCRHRRKHPYYAECWKDKMLRLPDPEPDSTIVAMWWKDRRRKVWGGQYVDVADGVPLGGIRMPLKPQGQPSADDLMLQKQQTRSKWSAWLNRDRITTTGWGANVRGQ